MKATVRTPVITVITRCSRMITRKPITPPTITRPATTTSATILVGVPLAQPSRSNTVAVASVARMVRTVSQPTVSSHDTRAGSRLPRTPNAARLSTSVGADPRLPATATKPQKRNDTTIADDPHDGRLGERDAEAEHEGAVAQAEDRDVRAEPGPEQLGRAAVPLVLGDHVEAVRLDPRRRAARLVLDRVGDRPGAHRVRHLHLAVSRFRPWQTCMDLSWRR